MVLFGAIFIGLLIYSPSRSFATIAFVGTPTPLPIFPTIENMRIGELEGEYKIEITTFNPSQQDLLVTHIGISAIETDYSYVCCCGEIGDYKISDQIAVEGDIDNLSFSAKVEQESGELKGFIFPAEGTVKTECNVYELTLDFDTSFLLPADKHSAFFVSVPRRFKVIENNSRGGLLDADAERLDLSPISIHFPDGFINYDEAHQNYDGFYQSASMTLEATISDSDTISHTVELGNK